MEMLDNILLFIFITLSLLPPGFVIKATEAFGWWYWAIATISLSLYTFIVVILSFITFSLMIWCHQICLSLDATQFNKRRILTPSLITFYRYLFSLHCSLSISQSFICCWRVRIASLLKKACLCRLPRAKAFRFSIHSGHFISFRSCLISHSQRATLYFLFIIALVILFAWCCLIGCYFLAQDIFMVISGIFRRPVIRRLPVSMFLAISLPISPRRLSNLATYDSDSSRFSVAFQLHFSSDSSKIRSFCMLHFGWRLHLIRFADVEFISQLRLPSPNGRHFQYSLARIIRKRAAAIYSSLAHCLICQSSSFWFISNFSLHFDADYACVMAFYFGMPQLSEASLLYFTLILPSSLHWGYAASHYWFSFS